ncbi:hypothetical protein GCM10011609_07900 [Lentzea pudingi]|uniref:Uncharacterized protein n=1 Tax=Lentzea pudingi TaxID=1789439 RepID=A0ABQ2HBI3_9PSEU|nr:hypothetical protein GCM10011609_07900 [Lentzea pudingi]
MRRHGTSWTRTGERAGQPANRNRDDDRAEWTLEHGDERQPQAAAHSKEQPGFGALTASGLPTGLR